jgi:hypothetical protein
MMFEKTGSSGKFDGDYLDEYCMRIYGHKDWEYTDSRIMEGAGEGILVWFPKAKTFGEYWEDEQDKAELMFHNNER